MFEAASLLVTVDRGPEASVAKKFPSELSTSDGGVRMFRVDADKA
jgi:hypothetical protein